MSHHRDRLTYAAGHQQEVLQGILARRRAAQGLDRAVKESTDFFDERTAAKDNVDALEQIKGDRQASNARPDRYAEKKAWIAKLDAGPQGNDKTASARNSSKRSTKPPASCRLSPESLPGTAGTWFAGAARCSIVSSIDSKSGSSPR